MAAGDSATLVADLSIDAGTLPRPTWQEYKERATFLVPAFLSAGLFIVVVGLGVVVMVVAQRKTWTAADRGGVVRSLFIAGAVSLVLSALLALDHARAAWPVRCLAIGHPGRHCWWWAGCSRLGCDGCKTRTVIEPEVSTRGGPPRASGPRQTPARASLCFPGSQLVPYLAQYTSRLYRFVCLSWSTYSRA